MDQGYDLQHDSWDLRLLCSCCGRLLRDPQQNSVTGKLCCRPCLPVSWFPDKAVDREVKSVSVRCMNQDRGCCWQGTLQSYLLEHLEPCAKSSKRQLNKTISDLKQRLAESSTGIGVYGAAPSFNDLQDLPGEDNLEPVHPTAETVEINATGPPYHHAPLELQTQTHVSGAEDASKTSPRKTARKPPPCDFDEEFARTKEKAHKLRDFRQETREKLDSTATATERVKRGTETYTRKSMLRYASSEEYPATRQHFFDFSRNPSDNSGMQCRWILTNVTQRIKMASSDPHTPIVSPPWYTRQCGYCLQAHLFLNGHGSSMGSTVSIFMSPVQGLHDNFLKWPLVGQLRFALLNPHSGNYDVHVKLYFSDPKSGTFRRPTTGSSHLAFGSRRFISIKRLLKEYVKDDTVYLELAFHHT